MRRAIKAWLKAGVLDGDELFPTTEGSPQGGVISPLLMNVALHGLEEATAEAHPKVKVIRYADDLVALHPDLEVIKAAEATMSAWLAEIGLALKPSKTTITHTLNQYEGKVGLNFLSFHIRQYPVGKTHAGKTNGRNPKRLSYKTKIKPSQEAIKRHYQVIKQTIEANSVASQENLIKQLNPIIKGWTNYYVTVLSKEIFTKLAFLTYLKLKRWAKRRHPNKSWHWVSHKSWRLEKGTWDFAPKDGFSLCCHPQTPLKRHIKVRGTKSPYDGDWVYWANRRAKQPGIPKRVTVLLKRQTSKCNLCGLYFKPDDKIQVDHIIPRSQGGTRAI